MAATEAQFVILHLALQGEIPGNAGSSVVDLPRIAKERLGVALSEVLAPLNAGEDQLVFIRKLEVDLDLDDQMSPRDIAVAWANRIKKAFVAAVAGKTANIVVFPNPATFLARFLIDCAQGHANGVWYYRQYDGLWPLTASAAIRTAVLSDVPLAMKAMRCLPDHQAVGIFDVLTNEDAERLLEGLGVAAEMTDPGFIEEMMDPGFIELQRYLVRVSVEQLLSESGLDRKCFFQALVSGNRSLLPKQASSGLQTYLDSLFKLEAGVRRLLANEVVSPDAPTVDSTPGVRCSRFGNAMLLWPQLAASSWYRQFEGWEPLGEAPARNILALLTLCACQGRGRFEAAWNDALLRDLCGVGPSLSLRDTLDWLNSQVDVSGIYDLGRIFRAEFDSSGPDEVRRLLSREFGEFENTVARPKGVWTGLRMQPDAQCSTGDDSKDADDESEQSGVDAADLELLWLADPLADTQTRIFIALLAQHTLRTFAYRLAGFSGSSLRYLINNLLSMSVNYVSDDLSAVAYLSRVPLSVVLNMAGINRGEVTLPNLSARPIRLAESG